MSSTSTSCRALPGQIMGDVLGAELQAVEREYLQHPNLSGIILFARNYDNPQQLKELVKDIRKAANDKPLLIATDHEGGRVQRFREGFTRLAPMRELGHIYDQSAAEALLLAQHTGQVIASELQDVGIDFSFTPVVDLDAGRSRVIGDRAFHSDPLIVAELCKALLLGLKQGGMEAVAKHFPGHGEVAADSHLELPVDSRSWDEIQQSDLLTFSALIEAGVAGVMPAHVVYNQVDSYAAGFSHYWMMTVLREQLGFNGAIFSDDLSMQGAHVAGSAVQRAEAALSAGCDMLLCCNNPDDLYSILDSIPFLPDSLREKRLGRLLASKNRLSSDAKQLAIDAVSALQRSLV